MNIVDIRGQGAGTRHSNLDMLMNSIKKARVAMGEEPAHFLNMMDGNFITLQVGVVIISIISISVISQNYFIPPKKFQISTNTGRRCKEKAHCAGQGWSHALQVSQSFILILIIWSMMAIFRIIAKITTFFL